MLIQKRAGKRRFRALLAQDVAAIVVALGLLGPCTRVVSPVAAGSGSVRTAHGTVPVPVPAVLRMLADAAAPLSAHPAAMELCTPTGAALLTTMATAWGAAPACTVLDCDRRSGSKGLYAVADATASLTTPAAP